MISYPAHIKYDLKERVYYVEFPDLPGCQTYGETKEDALNNAREALTGYLESIDLRKLKIPKPSLIKNKGIHFISPNKNVSFAIWLKMNREKMGLTQADIASKLHVTCQTYQRFEDPVKSNPTLKTITRLEEVFKQELLHI